MGTKPNPKAWKARSSLESAHSEAPARPHPWLKAYPKSVTWDVKIEPKLLGDQLDQAVAAYGARPCTYFMGKRLSYAEIGALSDRAAKGLREEGVGEGVKVGLFMPNTPAFVIFYYGVLKAGGTVVNFNPLYSLEEIETQIRDSGVKIMVTLDLALTYDKIEALLKRRALERAVVVSFTSLLPALKSVGFKLTQRAKLAAVGRAGERARLVSCRRPARQRWPIRAPGDHARCDRRAAIYRWHHRNAQGGDAVARQSLGQYRPAGDLAEPDRQRGRSHRRGASSVPRLRDDHCDEFWHQPRARDHPAAEIRVDPDLEVDRQVAADHDAWRADAIQRHARYPHIGNFDLTSLKYCMAGGAPLPIEVKRGFEAISGAILVEGYGLSETSPVAACNPPDAPREGSIGLPLPATEISIRSLDDPHSRGQDRRDRRDLHRRSPGDDRLLEQASRHRGLLRGRFFRTGDVGYMDEDGYVFIVDRIKDVINASGFKVYPRRIEEALYEHPAVAEVVVIGITDAYRGEAPKAFVKLTGRERGDGGGADPLSEGEALQARASRRDRVPRRAAEDA